MLLKCSEYWWAQKPNININVKKNFCVSAEAAGGNTGQSAQSVWWFIKTGHADWKVKKKKS